MKDSLTETDTPGKKRQEKDFGLLIMLLLLIMGTLVFAIVDREEPQSTPAGIERILQP